MKFLAIGAHPDDVEFGATPLLIQEVKKGHQVKIIVCSLGEAGTSGTPEGRKKEAADAAAVAGAEIEFLDLGGDSHIEYTSKNGFKIAEAIRKFQPNIVLAPSLTENQHPDHANVARITRAAARFARYGGLAELKGLPVHKIDALYYYGSSAEWDKKPDIVIDVTAVKTEWEKAMLCHTSQMNTKQYTHLVFTKAAALGASIGAELAVGLYSNDPVRLGALSDINLSSRNY